VFDDLNYCIKSLVREQLTDMVELQNDIAAFVSCLAKVSGFYHNVVALLERTPLLEAEL